MSSEPSTPHTIIDTVTKILAVMVIPLVMWAVKLEVQLATANVERQQLYTEIKRVSDDNAAVLSSVRENTLALKELQTTMVYIKDRVDEIKREMKDEAK
ncbi:MAG: hypothetical protein CMF52_03015 [Legionellales bacterium]|nr:hypothetical protein [Legionellales bacterium]